MAAPFSPSFLNGEPRATAFLADDFRHPARRAEKVRAAARRSTSSVTLAALSSTSARLAKSSARRANLERLAKGNAAVVVTGQQVGLFGGPLYSLVKAASAVSVAKALSAETGVPCVPVFWLQSEDHDFPEIDHCWVLPKSGDAVRLSLDGPGPESRRSVSCLTLGAGVEAIVARLATELDGLPCRDEAVALVRRHYLPERSWVEAFLQLMGEVFASDGLLFIDPRASELVEEARPLHERVFAEHAAVSKVLLEREAALSRAGFEVQVPIRPEVSLNFVHAEGFDGPRARVAPSSRLSKQAVFSSSALLRPLVQDTLLPTAAIVAGPGELNYFAQLPPLYDALGVTMPMLVPRTRVRVLDARSRSALNELGCRASDVEGARERVLASLVSKGQALSPDMLEQRLLDAVRPVLAEVPNDPRLGDAVSRTEKTIARAASRLKRRLAFALAERDSVLVQRVDRLRRTLFPNGEPQERVLSLPSMVARFGLEPFVSAVSRLEPFTTTVQELSL